VWHARHSAPVVGTPRVDLQAWNVPPDQGVWRYCGLGPLRIMIFPAGQPVTTESKSGRSVLIVDDEPALRAVAARVLELAGLTVTTAANGFEALEQIERDGPPELVLTDLRMPRMGGIELKIMLNARWPNVGVLFMSGYSAEYLRLDGTIEECDLLLQKPYTAKTLLEHVRTVLALTPPGGQSAVQ